MRDLSGKLTELCVENPKTAVAVCFLTALVLSSSIRFVEFDNTEDGFFPDFESTRLMYEVEREYWPEVEEIHIIVGFGAGGLAQRGVWKTLASIEAEIGDDSRFKGRHFALFDSRSVIGPASWIDSWQRIQDPVHDDWSHALERSLQVVQTAEGATSAVEFRKAASAVATVPLVRWAMSQELAEWDPGDPVKWLERLDKGTKLLPRTTTLLALANKLEHSERSDLGRQTVSLGRTVRLRVAPVHAMQSIDFKSKVAQLLGGSSERGSWSNIDKALVSLAVDARPQAGWGVSPGGATGRSSVREAIASLAADLEEDLTARHPDVEVTVYSTSRFEKEVSVGVEQELRRLTIIAILLVGLALYWRTRNIGEAVLVLSVTLVAIAATYGVAGIFRFRFNAAMSGIPMLILAIGVDYVLHVVMRSREEMAKIPRGGEEVSPKAPARSGMISRAAILRGTSLTGAALLISSSTDIVGFLSFRLSSQEFLLVFGTVIAIGIFFVYLLSITLIPAVLSLRVNHRPWACSVRPRSVYLPNWVGAQTRNPWRVLILGAVSTSVMAVGVGRLEVGFDLRSQLDPALPVVAGFLALHEEFDRSPAPMYVVIDADPLTSTGRLAYDWAKERLDRNQNVGTSDGLWDALRRAQIRHPSLREYLSEINLGKQGAGAKLKRWLVGTRDGREISRRYLRSDGRQTVISFYASTLDWKDTVDFQQRLVDDLNPSGPSSASPDEPEYRVTGRNLVLAQTQGDISRTTMISTAMVAGVVLAMLLVFNLAREGALGSAIVLSLAMWIPLVAVMVWTYGFMGWAGYEISSQSTTIGALVLCLGIDYAVHYECRLREEMKATPAGDVESWNVRTAATTGDAMLSAGLTTAIGFASLSFSSIEPVRLFGQIFVISIGMSLLSSLTLLPCLLKIAHEPIRRKLHAGHRD